MTNTTWELQSAEKNAGKNKPTAAGAAAVAAAGVVAGSAVAAAAAKATAVAQPTAAAAARATVAVNPLAATAATTAEAATAATAAAVVVSIRQRLWLLLFAFCCSMCLHDFSPCEYALASNSNDKQILFLFLFPFFRWMERENAKIRKKYIRSERARIQKLVETAHAA